jgi:hypothetical protein
VPRAEPAGQTRIRLRLTAIGASRPSDWPAFFFAPTAMAKSHPPDLLGLNVSGDLGAYTLYTNRNRKLVVYPRSPPQVPATPQQLAQRARFAAAIANWTAAPAATKYAYEAITLRLSIPMTGLNLWIALSFRNDQQLLDTLTRQSAIYAPLPDPV